MKSKCKSIDIEERKPLSFTNHIQLFTFGFSMFWSYLQKIKQTAGFLILTVLLLFSTLKAYGIEDFECIAPAKPGGGLDLACQLLSESLSLSHLIDVPMKVTYMPGGIGALAFNYIAGTKKLGSNTVVGFSTGSALNIAQKKFGKYDETSVRWLGALVSDYGIIAVRSDSNLTRLDDLMHRLQKNPGELIFGAGGSIGSQDWMKSALLLRQAGVNSRQIRYVAYEGGGEAINALLNGHIQVFPGDLSEAASFIDTGQIRVLAILSKIRVKGKYRTIPTATEQGYPVEWPIWRGFYLPPNISNDDYNWWENTMRRLVVTSAFEKERIRLGFFPFAVIGQEFEVFVKKNVQQLRKYALEFELVK